MTTQAPKRKASRTPPWKIGETALQKLFHNQNNSATIDDVRKPLKQLVYSFAPTGNGKCIYCRKFIPKKTPVFWYWDTFTKRNVNYHPKNPMTGQKLINPLNTITLNIKKKICYRCIEGVFNTFIHKHLIEIRILKNIRKKFRRSLKGKKIKRSIENMCAVEELQEKPNPFGFTNYI
jgi:hypothetical protein